MTTVLTRAGLLAGLFAGAVLFAGGCNKPAPDAGDKGKEKGKGAGEEKDDHSGWWCKPHGIPEEECSMCSEGYAKKCKDKGDWCEKHDRADSQCFICHPELKEKFAAKHRARYGTEPPPMKRENAAAPSAPGPAGAAKPAATTITVPDMDCEVCAKKAVAKLTAVAGVAKVDVNVEGRTLTVTAKEKETPSPKALWEACVAGGQEPTKLEGPDGAFAMKPAK